MIRTNHGVEVLWAKVEEGGAGSDVTYDFIAFHYKDRLPVLARLAIVSNTSL